MQIGKICDKINLTRPQKAAPFGGYIVERTAGNTIIRDKR
jgi:hypothetical protein